METIAAIATPPGVGGIGVIRVSGEGVRTIAEHLFGQVPEPRQAIYRWFRDSQGEPIDGGLVLFFPKPHSFTGEDVLELQGHGSPIALDRLLSRLLDLGARLARPGEFSERAFLNGKLDLAQAESIADLIESGTETAARLAARTLEGAFSRRIQDLVEDLIQLRTQVEAALDFSEEDIDLLADEALYRGIQVLREDLEALIANAHQGCLIQEGIRIALAGPPNAGKSSLLNALAGREVAIVTEMPGTTRDPLHRTIQIDGIPLHLVDTAGLRAPRDPIEREGIRRTRHQLHRADAVLWVYDGYRDSEPTESDLADLPRSVPVLIVRNKIDLSNIPPSRTPRGGRVEIALSAREGTGLDLLGAALKELAGYRDAGEGLFLAHRRHLDALRRARATLETAERILGGTAPLELAAEELRQTQRALGEITGAFSTEDLLGRIFAGFCIGK